MKFFVFFSIIPLLIYYFILLFLFLQLIGKGITDKPIINVALKLVRDK